MNITIRRVSKGTIIGVVLLVVVIIGLVVLFSKSDVKVYRQYLYDMAISDGKILDESVSALGAEDAYSYDNLALLFDGLGIEGLDSSYVYVVSKDSTMLYHPTKEKVGQPVSNEVVLGVCVDLRGDKPVEPKFVQYVFNGVNKYAAYYVTADKQAVVVATADEEEILDENSLNNILVPNLDIYQSYLKDMAISTGRLIDSYIAADGADVVLSDKYLTDKLQNTKISGISSSYIYVVAADSTMLYHPTTEKIGKPVTNEVVRSVASGLSKGLHYNPAFTQYVFKGVSKYAAYYVTADEKAIVVATVDEKELKKITRKNILKSGK